MDLLQQLQAEGASADSLLRVGKVLHKYYKLQADREWAARIAERTQGNLVRVPSAIDKGVLDYAKQRVEAVIEDNNKLLKVLGLIE